MKLDVRLKKNKILRCFKRRQCGKVCCEHCSFTFVFTFSVVDLPTDCVLSFLFPAETDVLVPVLFPVNKRRRRELRRGF